MGLDDMKNCCLSGRIIFPERPIYLGLCTFVADKRFRKTARCAVLIIVKGTKPLRWFIPLKP